MLRSFEFGWQSSPFLTEGEVLIDWSEIFHTSLNFAAVRGKKPPSYLDR